MGKKHTIQDLAIGLKQPYYHIDQTIILFNTALVRAMAQSLGGDYTDAVIQTAEGLGESPDELFEKLTPELQGIIRLFASKNQV